MMACIVTLMGSVLGFVAGIAALVLFQVPFGTALLIWTGAGVGCVALGLVLASAPHSHDDAEPVQELA
jgi:hypothetical protein